MNVSGNSKMRSRFNVGVAYYPEQWSESRWEADAVLMRDAGVTIVRLGEFAWYKFEPEEGKYDFRWLEKALNILGAHGIEAILCTPTATYPAWLHRKYPDIHQVKSNGQVKEFGQRQDACKNHSAYRHHALNIAERVTAHFGKHQRVLAWQTDNELGCHGTARCYCMRCERAFQSWLLSRFEGDIGLLNRAWGTSFWGQQYNDFSEISLPRDTADRAGVRGQNPSLLLDFFRFSSDVQLEFNRELVRIIRANSPSRLVTHNLMGDSTDIDYFHLARDLDVVSWDNYPFFQSNANSLPPASFSHDLMRGLKSGNVWVMEQATGPGGWDWFYPTPEPGRMRLWAFQSIAHGADFLCFFRWRTARYGTEQFWHGILPHHGSPGQRYQELKTFGSEIERISSVIIGSTIESEVAIIYDYDSLWGLEIQPQDAQGISYYSQASAYATALSKIGIVPDILSATEDFSRYRLVIIPSHYVVRDAFPSKVNEYVESGGAIVVGARTAVKDEENAVRDSTLPAGLVSTVGCTVEDYDAFSFLADDPVQVVWEDGTAHVAEHLAEILKPHAGSETLLTYQGRYYSGRVAAVRNRVGKGLCYYLGTFLSSDALGILLRRVLSERNVSYMEDLHPAIEVTARQRDGRFYRFYLNHHNGPVFVSVVREGRDLISGNLLSGKVKLNGLQVAIVEELPEP